MACVGGCYAYCEGGCDLGVGCEGCGDACTGCYGCSGSCTANCADNCTGGCKTKCTTGCKGGCKSGCTNACTGSCNSRCTGTDAETTVARLNTSTLALSRGATIAQQNFDDLRLILNAALRNAGSTSSVASVGTTTIKHSDMNTIYTHLTNLSQTPTASTSQGSKATGATFDAFSSKAIAAWNTVYGKP